MFPTWNDLQLNSVDMHLHAGTERPQGSTLAAVLNAAAATGRRVICLTDHWWKYTTVPIGPRRHYPGTIEGYGQFAREAFTIRESYPDLCLLFGPEISFPDLVAEGLTRAFSAPGVDVFLGEPYSPPEGTSNGDYLVSVVEAIARVRDRWGCPGFLVHPLRAAIQKELAAKPLAPRDYPCPLRDKHADPGARMEEVLDVSIERLANSCVELGVSVEINNNDFLTILGSNDLLLLEFYLLFYRALRERGVDLLLGSDVHDVENGGATAFVPAIMLGLEVRSMSLLERWLGPRLDRQDAVLSSKRGT